MKFFEIKFAGGLGNQLFQYAAARSLMKKGDILLFNLNEYHNDYYSRTFSLLYYRVKGKIISSNTGNKIFTAQTKLNSFLNRLGLFSLIQEKGFFIQPQLDIRCCKTFTSLQGYWQSEKYFIKIRKTLLQELIPQKIPAFPAVMSKKDTVAVHVRRTDYLNDNRYGFLGEDYYHEAIKFMKQKLGRPTFIFFSDDIEWCKNTFENENISFCQDPNWQADYLQLFLISKCSHQIIANSSFSWWGAWLNLNIEKLVIRPQKPFMDQSLHYENYYPSNWIAL